MGLNEGGSLGKMSIPIKCPQPSPLKIMIIMIMILCLRTDEWLLGKQLKMQVYHTTWYTT